MSTTEEQYKNRAEMISSIRRRAEEFDPMKQDGMELVAEFVEEYKGLHYEDLQNVSALPVAIELRKAAHAVLSKYETHKCHCAVCNTSSHECPNPGEWFGQEAEGKGFGFYLCESCQNHKSE